MAAYSTTSARIQRQGVAFFGAGFDLQTEYAMIRRSLRDDAAAFQSYDMRQALEHPGVMPPHKLQILKDYKTYLLTLEGIDIAEFLCTPPQFRAKFVGANAQFNTYTVKGAWWNPFSQTSTAILSTNLVGIPGDVENITHVHKKVALLFLMGGYSAGVQQQIRLQQGNTQENMNEANSQISEKLADPNALIATGITLAQVMDLKAKFSSQLTEEEALQNTPEEVFRLMSNKPAAVQASFLKYAVSQNLINSGQVGACRDLCRRACQVFKFYN